MSYTTNIPVIGQSLGASRPGINSNFQYINTWAKQNHYFNETNGGRHKFVELPNQGTVPPAVSRIGNEVTLYGKSDGAVSQLWLVRDASGTEIQLTSGSNAPVNNFNGYSFLPGGILIQWGFIPNGSGTSGTTNFNINFKTSQYNVQLLLARNASGGDSIWQDTSGTNDRKKFSWKGTTGTYAYIYWFAIGDI